MYWLHINEHLPLAPYRRPSWRIEIKKYPKLTEIGSQRSETMVDYFYTHYPFKYDGKPHGGFTHKTK